jgi:hypothetical protein
VASELPARWATVSRVNGAAGSAGRPQQRQGGRRWGLRTAPRPSAARAGPPARGWRPGDRRTRRCRGGPRRTGPGPGTGG